MYIICLYTYINSFDSQEIPAIPKKFLCEGKRSEQLLSCIAEMPDSCMFTAHSSHMHVVNQKTAQSNFSEADEMLLTDVKNGLKNYTIDLTNSCTVLPTKICLCTLWQVPTPAAQLWECWLHSCQAQVWWCWPPTAAGSNIAPTLISNQGNESTNLCELQLQGLSPWRTYLALLCSSVWNEEFLHCSTWNSLVLLCQRDQSRNIFQNSSPSD